MTFFDVCRLRLRLSPWNRHYDFKIAHDNVRLLADRLRHEANNARHAGAEAGDIAE